MDEATTIYPNDGQAVGTFELTRDDDQDKRAREEMARIGASLPVIEEVIAWFNDQLLATDSTRNVDLASPVPAEAQVLAYRKLCELLTMKRDEFQSKFDAYEAARREQANG